MAKIMRKKNLKIQNLAGNTLKSCLHSGSQISTTLSKNIINIVTVKKISSMDMTAIKLIMDGQIRTFKLSTGG